MKIGDIVKQTDKLIKISGRTPSTNLGTVIAIHEQIPEGIKVSEHQRKWLEHVGRRIDVMWQNGRLSVGFAEKSLVVVGYTCNEE